MTTITRLKQLKAMMTGQQQPQRIERDGCLDDLTPGFDSAAHSQLVKLAEQEAREQHANGQDLLQLPGNRFYITTDRFASYRVKIMPKLQADGYVYFLACASNDYQEHEEWCHTNCEDFTLPYCDVWQLDQQYPRAFASQADAMLFCLTFDAYEIGGDE